MTPQLVGPANMHLFYEDRDDAAHEARGSQILYWLDDLGARPFTESQPADRGFLFAGARPISDYAQLVANAPEHQRPARGAGAVAPTRLDSRRAGGRRGQGSDPANLAAPLDSPLPVDITFPLFVRAAHTSLKLGGRISRVRTVAELEAEAAELRRVLGWDALLLAREWHDLAEAGRGMYGPIPQEVRVWIVDGQPYAWSFHYFNILPSPRASRPRPRTCAR